MFLRHASVADTLLPAVFIANPNGLKLRYVLKHELLLDPCLDIVGNRLPNAFVRRNSGDSFRVIELMKNLGPRDGVIISGSSRTGCGLMNGLADRRQTKLRLRPLLEDGASRVFTPPVAPFRWLGALARRTSAFFPLPPKR